MLETQVCCEETVSVMIRSNHFVLLGKLTYTALWQLAEILGQSAGREDGNGNDGSLHVDLFLQRTGLGRCFVRDGQLLQSRGCEIGEQRGLVLMSVDGVQNVDEERRRGKKKERDYKMAVDEEFKVSHSRRRRRYTTMWSRTITRGKKGCQFTFRSWAGY